MSISSAFANATSGLRASSTMVDVIARNIANAMTDGHARTQVQLNAQTLGGVGKGVQVTEIIKAEDRIATSLRRAGDADAGRVDAIETHSVRMADVFGAPSDVDGLVSYMTAFDVALIAAANDPSDTQGLKNVAQSAQDAATKINQISTQANTIRSDADAEIALTVASLNAKLERIDALNLEIAKRFNSGDTTGLRDQRQASIDEISGFTTLNIVPRDRGEIAIFTADGGVLLDQKPSVIGFAPSFPIDQTTTLANGALSGLAINGRDAHGSDGYGLLTGGKIEGLFQVRDTLIPNQQAQLDNIAEDLIQRFQSASVDPTLGATDAGLLTDGGAFYDPLNKVGIASRIELNSLVDPAGGDVWRLRDGLNALAQGPAQDNSILSAMSDAFNALTPVVTTSGSTTSMRAFGYASDTVSAFAFESAQLTADKSAVQSKLNVLRDNEMTRIGVDTDAQMQSLILTEKIYAANAKVITSAQQMLDQLLRI
jgi:flagellar hook-associated protein 1 FlgK